MIQKLLDAYDCDTPHRVQGLFCNLFIQKNRMQTACEKIQQEITMKQWLLLAMLECCPEPKTLTNVGRLLGCSRQNVKKLAQTLEAKGYLTMTEGPNNTLCLHTTDKVEAYAQIMDQRRQKTLQLLFADFTEGEIAQFYTLHRKLYEGIQRVEAYAKTMDEGGKQ